MIDKAKWQAELLRSTADQLDKESMAYFPSENFRTLADLLEELAEQLEAAQPKWISVKDNPPDGTKEVIACNMYGEMLIGHVLAMSNGKDYYCETLQDNIYNVTHWMPRPKLPKEE